MSKILKFIVDVFMLAAIVAAAAILVPPLLGVNQTIVDSTSMVTNLPLGSVTYSTIIDVSDLKAGDEVLKETDAATYAYIIRSGDETTGQYNVVSSANQDGAEETIYLRNSVPKVAVVVPYIGYLMIAMHSVEGLIILGLVVILVIILFVLSELWKPEEEEDDEEEIEYDEEDESGIDTQTIREAVEENAAASGQSDYEAEEDEEEEEEPLTRAEKKARKKAEKEAKKAAKKAMKNGIPTEESAAAGQHTAPAAFEETEVHEEEPVENAPAEADPSVSPAAEEVEVPAETIKEETKAQEGTEKIQDPRYTATIEMPDLHKEQIIPEVMDISEITDIPEITGIEDIAEIHEHETPDTSDDIPNEIPDEENEERFAVVERQSLDDMMSDAEDNGENPTISKDGTSGVTVLDYSDLL